MNYEIINYDSRNDLDENQFNNSLKNYEEEYEFQNNNIIFNANNNIESFIPPQRLSNKMNKFLNVNSIQNSLSNMSNNLSRYEDQNNSISLTNNYLERNMSINMSNHPSIKNINVYDYNNKFLNDNNSITLLNLTDKIYEDDDHLKKGIISKKNENKGNFRKIEFKKKKSSKYGDSNKKERKSLFIANKENKDNAKETNNKKNATLKKRRASLIIEHKDKTNFGLFNKLKLRKNSDAFILKSENNNYDTNNIDEKKNKLKIIKNKTIKEVESNTKTNDNFKTKKIRVIKINKKSKLPPEELPNEDKNSPKKNNNNKIENKDINVTENNDKKTQVQNNKNKKTKKYICLFCCGLNYKNEDSKENISNKKSCK